MTDILSPARPSRLSRLAATIARSTVLVVLSAAATGLAVAPRLVFAEDKVDPAQAIADQPKKVRIIGPDGTAASMESAPLSDVERYCTNIADPAKDARAAIQAKRLQDLETEVSAKIDALEAKRKEYQDWLAQRQAFIDSTSDVVLNIYAGMKPDAAASQLAGLDRATAASIITKLKPRTASTFLAEMPAGVAAEITALIVQKTNKSMDTASAAAAPARG